MVQKIFAILLLFIVGSFVFANLASAQTINIWQGAYNCQQYNRDGTCGKLYTGSDTCNTTAGGCSLCNGLQVAINVINEIETLAVVITVGMIIYGAVRLMLSGGSEQMVKEARGIITSAVIGFIIVLCGWVIINTFIHIISPSGINFPWASIKC